MGPQGPAGATGPAGISDSSEGNIQGVVQLYDLQGNALADNSGATVSIENSSPSIQASSAMDGSFLLPSVHSGDYNLSVQKTGYGTMRFLNFQHPGGENPSQTGILAVGQQMNSQYDIQRLLIDTPSFGSSPYLIITVILAHPQITSNPVLLFISDAHGVTNANSLFSFRAMYFQENDSTLVFSPLDFSLYGYSDRFHSANFIYISAAMDNIKSFSYINEQGVQIFPCAGNLSNEVQVYNVLRN